MKLALGVSLLLLSTVCYSDEDMKFVSYEEVSDCHLPSTRDCHNDEHGQETCIIILNEKCKQEE